jgi:hypothetical protein
MGTGKFGKNAIKNLALEYAKKNGALTIAELGKDLAGEITKKDRTNDYER